MRLRTHRKRPTRLTAAGTAVAAFLASLAGLIGTSVAPAGAGTNGLTTNEADCTTLLAPGTVAPFVQGLSVTGAPDPSPAIGGLFGASGTATETIIGPVIAGIEQALSSPMIGTTLTETVGSTDGTATGTFSYSHVFPQVAALGRQITGVSWVSGSTTLMAAAGTFLASDVGRFVAGPSGQGINPQSTITAVAADGASATISIATTAASVGAVNVGTGANMTFADPAFSTGNVFTTNIVSPAIRANVGVMSVTSVVVNALIPITFGGSPGVGTANCLLTGFDAANSPGPAQMGALTPVLPPGTTTRLVAASGGFISQTGTAQKITPPAAASVTAVLAIATAALPDGTVGVPYGPVTLQATGGTPPLTWSATGLPPGLTLGASTGVISGTPATDVGSPFSVAVTVTDSGTPPGSPAQTASKTLSLTVHPAPPAVVIDDSIDVIVGGVRSAATGKTFVDKVTNLGTGTWHVCDTTITNAITVKGVATAGSIAPLNPGCVDLAPGGSHRFRFHWTFGVVAGVSEVTPGATVVFKGSVPVRTGDVNPANNTDMETRIAK